MKKIQLPHWFEPAFKHLDKKEYQQMAELYRQEPLLQELTAELDKQNPLFRKITRCLYCHGTNLLTFERKNKVSYFCNSCKKNMSPSTGTLFFRLAKQKYPQLYALLVTLWSDGTKEKIITLTKVCDAITYIHYRKRLKPIIDLTKGKIITANPRYLHGFTPKEQGVICRYCSSTRVDYVLHYPQENPELICRKCKKHFLFYPNLSPKETPKAKTIAQLTPPKWFPKAFAHVSSEQYDLLCGIWSEEPVLRDLIDMIDAQNPDLDKRAARCPICYNLARKRAEIYSWHCTACHKGFSTTQGTIFSRTKRYNFMRPYTIAVMLWTPYLIKQALPLCNMVHEQTFYAVRRRLQPLLDELLADKLPTQRPRYLLGFTLGEQGVYCPRCQSNNVTAWKSKGGTDNPSIYCNDCNGTFRLHYVISTLKENPDERIYSSDFRKKVLLTQEREGLSVAETAKRFDISTSSLNRWIRKTKKL